MTNQIILLLYALDSDGKTERKTKIDLIDESEVWNFNFDFELQTKK